MLRVLLTTIYLFLIDSSRLCHGLSQTFSTNFLSASKESRDSPIQFDLECVANPVVRPPDDYISEWQCYYYGNNGNWNGGRDTFLPTGSTGLAVSKDGLKNFIKVAGKERDGAVLVPSDSGWDSVHIGGNDIIRVGKELHMYYFGGSDEEISMGPSSIVGLRMRIGRAKSHDNGMTWTKENNYLLDYDESEGFFASWPRIVQFDDRPWLMTYHSFDGKKWRVFSAESDDQGESWQRTGLILEGGDSEEDFDYAGIGTRSVIKWRGGLLMIYEGVCSKGIHRFGAAFNDLKTNGWTKLNKGLPILEPGEGPIGKWADAVIGTPFAVPMADGSIRLYHCGKEERKKESKMKIGVIESKTGDIETEAWTALPLDLEVSN